MRCPQCQSTLRVVAESKKDFTHIFEMCSFCGYAKAFVDYLDSDTGPVDWAGIDH